jgi:hypothetical protein
MEEGLNQDTSHEEDEAFRDLEARLAAADDTKRKQGFTGFEVKMWADGFVVSQAFHNPGEIAHLRLTTPVATPVASPVQLMYGYQLTPHVMSMPGTASCDEAVPEEIED